MATFPSDVDARLARMLLAQMDQTNASPLASARRPSSASHHGISGLELQLGSSSSSMAPEGVETDTSKLAN